MDKMVRDQLAVELLQSTELDFTQWLWSVIKRVEVQFSIAFEGSDYDKVFYHLIAISPMEDGARRQHMVAFILDQIPPVIA